MDTEVRLNVDTTKVDAALAKLGVGLSAALPAPLQVAFRRAGVIYTAWARARFVKASRGDGTWLPLSILTKLARLRKNKTVWGKFLQRKKELKAKGDPSTHVSALAAAELQGTSFEILRDTGALLNSMSSGGPGNVQELTDHGVRLGSRVFYSGYHNAPTIPGHPPQRVIVPLPPPAVLQQMTGEVQVGVNNLVREAGL